MPGLVGCPSDEQKSTSHFFLDDHSFLVFSDKGVVQVLLLVTGLLAICHVLSVYLMGWSLQMERTFHFDLENNIPTWFSNFLWTLAALVAYSCSQRSIAVKEKRTWLITAVALIFLACDEIASLHENVGLVFSKYFLPESVVGALGMRLWPIVCAPFIAIIFSWFALKLRPCFRNSSEASKRLILGSALFLAGAMGLEVIMNFLMFGGFLKWFWEIETVFEELLEILGVITIISALLVHNRVLMKRSKQLDLSAQFNENKRTVVCQG